MTEANVTSTAAPAPARNEPCPCGSKKKYKRCCGVSAAPKLYTPAIAAAEPAQGGAAGGAPDLQAWAQSNPQAMAQMAQMLQRLPKGQIQRIQGLMQKAMAGKDVTREAAEMEASLPPAFKEMMKGFQMPGMEGSTSGSDEAMTVDQAKDLVAKAAAEGKISEEEAKALLAAQGNTPAGSKSDLSTSKESGLSKLWKKVAKKG